MEPKLLALVHLRASQINSCSACVYASVAGGKKAGDTDERLHNVAAWREAPFYTDAERAALALTEAATRLQDVRRASPTRSGKRPTPTSPRSRSARSTWRSRTNSFNRINRTIKEPAGKTWG